MTYIRQVRRLLSGLINGLKDVVQQCGKEFLFITRTTVRAMRVLLDGIRNL